MVVSGRRRYPAHAFPVVFYLMNADVVPSRTQGDPLTHAIIGCGISVHRLRYWTANEFWVFSRSSGWFGAREPPASGQWRVLSFLFFSSPFFSLLRTVIDPLRLAGLENLRGRPQSKLPSPWHSSPTQRFRIKAESATPPNLMQSIGVTDERATVSQ